MASPEPTVCIVGGGVAGLHLATLLTDVGVAFELFEARLRLGGRVLSLPVDAGEGAARFDLGPAWFWPEQPRITALATTLGLEAFPQFTDGAGTFEDQRGRVARGDGLASMAGSLRLDGGMGALVDALAASLPPERLHTGIEVSGLEQTERGVDVRLGPPGERKTMAARLVALALPPRVAAELTFSPPLPGGALETLRATPTWMGGQAKVVATYERAFWRAAGLSGDAMSQRGPLAEIHDASTRDGSQPALFGFVGVADRRDPAALLEACRRQLVRLFGPEAGSPKELLLQDWAREPETATEQDQAPLRAHPAYGMPDALRGLYDSNLVWASSEVAPRFGGYLEGALLAADAAAAQITRRLARD